ncbi:hypothetical protein MTR67_044599 [Solanum verrucosum]|uniref:Tf2-1-like SH3-like domain-containing protein n=1 Tax=Solanum verrucosum TaxID=315347 RepID=A0AAF0ZW81_SOLVR|nr:hypothetical protein MTR67_044599 [Solanum verrucosum]
MKGVMMFRKKGKLSPRFIGDFEILNHVVEVAYKLALPPNFFQKMSPRRVNIRNQPTALVDPLNEQVTHAEFRAAFQVLAQSKTVQVNQQAMAPTPS